MALPHTVIELLDRANVTGNERLMYEQRFIGIFQRIRDKAYRDGKEVGFSEGMDACFDVTVAEEEIDDVQTIP